MTAQLELPGCPVQGCTNLTGRVGVPCDECLVDFGDLLQPTVGPPPTAQALAERDERHAAAVEMQRQVALRRGLPGEVKQGQRCWLCEEVRKCERTAQGWECPKCRTIR